MYYKPIDNLNQNDTVQIVSIGKPEQGKYGSQYQCEVVVNGTAMQWTMSQVKHDQFFEAGFKQGDTVLFEKWRDGIKKGYNFKSPDKSNPYNQDIVNPQDVKYADPPQLQQKDDIQERIVKGMVYNNTSRRASNDCTPEAILDLCKAEYEVMKKWLTT